ncbi:hypothetical protein TRFO_29520 [Tritrichomonas foetus]|uniref:Uncharacterized protein n=1 Tax=Tritrichomonas foetus TaxID=1144522 RepID=A0A1J4JVQ2_9EUKA|nr:hypothetical protein TRFO_29520 [Tritrichomonas foetus]|eukprot:OHT03207.1 hypothetical protein TRFO_29520 [Tritrichomonas foetus]
MILVIFFLISLSFDSRHCKNKCEILFGDSPTKKSQCLSTCSIAIFEASKQQVLSSKEAASNSKGTGQQFSPESYLSDKSMKKDVINCLNSCSKDANSATDFRMWKKCRKSCLVVKGMEPLSIMHFFEPEKCRDDCDRYWNGTIHWGSCQEQCDNFEQSNSKIQSNVEKAPPPQPLILFDVW